MKTNIFVQWYAYSLHADPDKWCVTTTMNAPQEDEIVARTSCHLQAFHIAAIHNKWLEQVKDACGLNAVDAAIADVIEKLNDEKN